MVCKIKNVQNHESANEYVEEYVMILMCQPASAKGPGDRPGPGWSDGHGKAEQRSTTGTGLGPQEPRRPWI